MRKIAEEEDARAVVEAALSEHDGAFRAFLAARVPRSELDDIHQIASMRALERADSLRDAARVVPWLYRVFRNVIVDESRKRASQERVRAAQSQPSTTPEREATLCQCSVAQAKGLRPNYATILSMVDLGDATLSEAASSLGLSLGNATVRLHRARKALRQRMWEHCGVKTYRECISCRCAEDGCC